MYNPWQKAIANGIHAVFGCAGHHVEAQGVVLFHIGLGLVSEQSRGPGEQQGDGFQGLAGISRLKDRLDGITSNLVGEQWDERCHSGAPSLRQSHLPTAVGQLLQNGSDKELVFLKAVVLLDGTVETVVETAHATVMQA